MQTNEWTIQTGFQWISLLLAYPDADWTRTASEVKTAMPSISHPMADGVRTFLETVAVFDQEQRWDHYVRTFDFGKKTNLYLTYADYGEERERGPALLEMKKQYAVAGFELNATQMPDYLPAVLEFCAHTSVETAGRMLLPYADRVAQLQAALERIESPYSYLLQAVRQGIEMMQLESGLSADAKPTGESVAATPRRRPVLATPPSANCLAWCHPANSDGRNAEASQPRQQLNCMNTIEEAGA